MCGDDSGGGSGGGSAGGNRQNRRHDGNTYNPSMTPNRTNLSTDQAVSIANNPFSPHNVGQTGEGMLAAAQYALPGGTLLAGGRTLAMMNDGKQKAGKPSPNDSGSSSNPKRAVAGKVAEKAKETASLAKEKDKDDDLGGSEAALAPSRKRSNRQSTMLTGSQGIKGRANIGRTLLGA
jgi:hypothetical protein